MKGVGSGGGRDRPARPGDSRGCPVEGGDGPFPAGSPGTARFLCVHAVRLFRAVRARAPQCGVGCVRRTERHIGCVQRTQRHIGCVQRTQRHIRCVQRTQGAPVERAAMLRDIAVVLRERKNRGGVRFSAPVRCGKSPPHSVPVAHPTPRWGASAQQFRQSQAKSPRGPTATSVPAAHPTPHWVRPAHRTPHWVRPAHPTPRWGASAHQFRQRPGQVAAGAYRHS
jgi:hypothetical protein